MPTYTGTSDFASGVSAAASGFGNDSWGGDDYTGAADPQPWSDSFPGTPDPPGYNDTYTGTADPPGYNDTYTGTTPPASTPAVNDTQTVYPTCPPAGPYYDYQTVNVPQQTIPVFGP